MVKEKGYKEWTNEKLDAMGPIPDADFNKYWPNKKLREITSPPQGRERHRKKHNISLTSSYDKAPEAKKTKTVETAEESLESKTAEESLNDFLEAQAEKGKKKKFNFCLNKKSKVFLNNFSFRI